MNRRSYSGSGNPMFGRKRPDLSLRNCLCSGSNHPFFGKKRPDHAEALRGRKHTEETKLKQSLGIRRWLEKDPGAHISRKDNPVYWPGVRMKLSLQKRGEKNPAWAGGIANEYHYGFTREIRERIRCRDNYSCQMQGCGLHEGPIAHDVHHVDYNKSNNLDSNLITLCKSCHAKTQFNRTYWLFVFRSLLCQPLQVSC